MEQPEEIKNRIRETMAGQRFAVLSTHNDGQPYASLVGFCVTDDLRHIVFSTPKSTRKFHNIQKDPRVAVLVNSSENQAADLYNAASVTATGVSAIDDARHRKGFLDLYLRKHPYLRTFTASPTTALITVAVDTYFIVRNFQKVVELHMKP